MKIAVTGATGIVGRFVTDYLAAHGHSIVALARSTSQRSGFVTTPRWIEGDVEDEHALVLLLQDTDALVHCAFSHIPGRYRGGEGDDVAGFWRANFGASARLLRLARQASLQRVVLLSSRAVFARRSAGEDPTTPVTDTYPTRPDTHYGMLKMAEEQLASAAIDLCVCALRPTGVYGVTYPETDSKWFDLVQTVLAGEPVTASRTSTEVHGEDVAQAVELLLHAEPAAVCGRAFNCSDVTVSTRQIVARVAELGGVDADLPPASEAVVNPMACPGLLAMGWRPGGEAKLDATLQRLISFATD